MNDNVIYGLVVLGIIIVASRFMGTLFKEQTINKKKKQYTYTSKEYLITQNENQFYNTLSNMVGAQYVIFPQIHLSAIVDHKVKGQNWKGAFSHINSKSVDYVVCTKQDLKPVCAIELDDSTHNREDRRLRDIEVDRILEQAHLPLIHISISDSKNADAVKEYLSRILHL